MRDILTSVTYSTCRSAYRSSDLDGIQKQDRNLNQGNDRPAGYTWYLLDTSRFWHIKTVTYAYGSLLRTLHRILKIPRSFYLILYVKTQNIVKLKKL